VTIPLHTTIKGGLAATILKSIAAHKRVEVHNILDTL
jgi:hypothetical protein